MTIQDKNLTKNDNIFSTKALSYEPENSVEAIILRILSGIEGVTQRAKIKIDHEFSVRSWSVLDDDSLQHTLTQFIAEIYRASSQQEHWLYRVTIKNQLLTIQCVVSLGAEFSRDHSLVLPCRASSHQAIPHFITEQLTRWQLTEIAKPQKATYGSILLIDASDDIAHFLGKIFRPHYGFQHVKTISALSKVQHHVFSVVVVDPILVDGNAMQICSKFNVPKIFLGTSEDENNLSWDAGAVTIFRKPFCAATLTKAVRNIIDIFHCTEKTSKSKQMDWSQKYLSAIKNNFINSEFNANQLAALLHTTERTLQRKSLELFCMSPAKMIEMERLRAALDMIRSGTSITDTAMGVGYDNLETFSRAFKRVYGLSPRDSSRIGL